MSTAPAAKAETSVAGLMADRITARLRVYRTCVATAARGDTLSVEAMRDIRKAMRDLGLPEYAFRRDVAAWAGASTARGYRRLELAWLHPHLFDDVDHWVRQRVSAVCRAPRAFGVHEERQSCR